MHTRSLTAAGTRLLSLPAALSLALVSCFRDTPTEPDGRPTPAGSELATSVVSNMISLGPPTMIAYGVNGSGQIVGDSRGSNGLEHAFSWKSGVMTELGTLGGGWSAASDINDAGLVVGGSGTHAVLWENGALTDLGTLPNACPSNSFAFAVNTAGQVVGQSNTELCDQIHHPVLWDGGRATDLGSLVGSRGLATAWDINDKGQVVGESQSNDGNPHAFLWDNGVMRDLGTLSEPSSYAYSYAYAINGSGQVVGQTRTSSFRDHAFLWSNGTMRDLGTLGGGSSSSALDINDNGQVVGYSETLTSTFEVPRRAFVWQNGIMSDLGTLPGNWSEAQAINNSGLIVGAASVGGTSHAVRWTIPTTNFWSELAALPSARRAHAVGTAAGLIYVIGGRDYAGTVLSSVRAYNPSSNTWSFKASLPTIRHTGNGAATLNRTIYVAGGRDGFGNLSRTLYAYEASTNTWSTKAPMPVLSGCGGSAIINSRLYVFSGCTRSSTGAQIPAGLLHRYNPSTNSWSTLRPAPAAHLGPAVGATGGKLYVVGGTTSSNYTTRRLEVYDPVTNTWSTKAPMPTGRVGMAGAVIAGKFYVLGGENAAGTTFRSVVEVYDPVSNSWSSKAEMLVPRSGLAAGVINNLLYVTGGRYKTKVLALNERYSP